MDDGRHLADLESQLDTSDPNWDVKIEAKKRGNGVWIDGRDGGTSIAGNPGGVPGAGGEIDVGTDISVQPAMGSSVVLRTVTGEGDPGAGLVLTPGNLELGNEEADTVTTLIGVVKVSGIATADPHVAGQVWSDGGTLKVSAGA